MTLSAAPVSLVLLAFNQAATVRAAAQSCLDQRGEPLEIVLSDDASTDDTHRVLLDVAAAYRGPHRVRVRRNETNLGIGAHYNRLLTETTGELLVTAAGDDISLPHRVQTLVAAWAATGRRAELVSSHYELMDADGTPGAVVRTDDLALVTLEGWCRRRPFTVGATHAFTRRMMARFGPFIDHVWYEDANMALRAVLAGGAVTVPEPLVRYRRGGTSHRPATHRGEQLLAWARVQNQRVRAESAQFIADATLAGRGPQVAASLAATMLRENYLHAMLDAPGAAQRWKACRTAHGLPVGWRLRKFLTFTWPEPAARLKAAKAALRRRAA
jgi:glycosyltransferase involved in cell wall biosynthesis